MQDGDWARAVEPAASTVAVSMTIVPCRALISRLPEAAHRAKKTTRGSVVAAHARGGNREDGGGGRASRRADAPEAADARNAPCGPRPEEDLRHDESGHLV